MNAICVLFLLCPQLRLSFVSVLFDFNASLNDIAPVSPIQFSDYYDSEKSGLLMDAICAVSFVFTTQIEFCECCVRFQCITHGCCSFFSNVVAC